MTVISTLQGVSAAVGADIPQQIFASSARHEVEMRHLALEAAAAIAEERDWLILNRQLNVSGNGVSTRHPLPADFARFRLDAKVLSTTLGRNVARMGSVENVLASYYRSTPASMQWGMDHNGLVIRPPLELGEVVVAVYQTKFIAAGEDGTVKPEFTADDDRFIMDERLLKLAIIWRWKSAKGLPYGQDFANYETALGKAIAHEGDRSAISLTHRTAFDHVKYAWPGVITP